MVGRFHYIAKKGPQDLMEDMLEADTYELAIGKIIHQGLTPLEVKEMPLSSPSAKVHAREITPAFAKRIRGRDVVIFTRQVSDLLESAVPIYKALTIIARQTENSRLCRVVDDLAQVVHGGGAFSDALSRYPEIFSAYYVNMARSGEAGGRLDAVMARLAGSLEQKQETEGKIKQSLAYPALIFAVGLMTIFVLISFVIPRIVVIFNDFDQALPGPTRLLMSVSGFFTRFWWLIIFVVGGGGVYGYQWLRTPQGKTWLDNGIIRVGGIGPLIKNVEISRFARTLGTLVESGVPIVAAIEVVENTVGNEALRAEVRAIRDNVTDGMSLVEAIRRGSFFTEAAVNMVAVGEETSRLEKGLYKIADIYEKESDGLVKTVIALLGPAVLTFVILIVGFVVVAMLLPILQMNLLID